MSEIIKDPYFRLDVVTSTYNPQQVCWAAMHQDYSEGLVIEERHLWPHEEAAGELLVKHLLNGGRGHFGPLEHPQITFNAGYFPHSLMQQARTHRVGISFDVQSFRYTGSRILKVVEGDIEIEKVFYLRPEGEYTDRSGKKYTYTNGQRSSDLAYIFQACKRYQQRINEGLSEEHARGLIPFDARQNFVVSVNSRSLMHLLDLRWKRDAQEEIRVLSEMAFGHFQQWMPSVANWYFDNRAKRARLAP